MKYSQDTITISLGGLQFEVRGTYSPFRAGAGWSAWSGPTPDEPEEFEIESIRVIDDNTGEPVGPDFWDFFDTDIVGGERMTRVIEKLCLEERDRLLRERDE